jgi:hypothetical protein
MTSKAYSNPGFDDVHGAGRMVQDSIIEMRAERTTYSTPAAGENCVRF